MQIKIERQYDFSSMVCSVSLHTQQSLHAFTVIQTYFFTNVIAVCVLFTSAIFSIHIHMLFSSFLFIVYIFSCSSNPGTQYAPNSNEVISFQSEIMDQEQIHLSAHSNVHVITKDISEWLIIRFYSGQLCNVCNAFFWLWFYYVWALFEPLSNVLDPLLISSSVMFISHFPLWGCLL